MRERLPAARVRLQALPTGAAAPGGRESAAAAHGERLGDGSPLARAAARARASSLSRFLARALSLSLSLSLALSPFVFLLFSRATQGGGTMCALHLQPLCRLTYRHTRTSTYVRPSGVPGAGLARRVVGGRRRARRRSRAPPTGPTRVVPRSHKITGESEPPACAMRRCGWPSHSAIRDDGAGCALRAKALPALERLLGRAADWPYTRRVCRSSALFVAVSGRGGGHE